MLFRSEIDGVFLTRESVSGIATFFGVDSVPIVLIGTIAEGVDFVRHRPNSQFGTAKMEGVVGRPKVELYDRFGNRVIVKIKVRDMEEIERYESH